MKQKRTLNRDHVGLMLLGRIAVQIAGRPNTAQTQEVTNAWDKPGPVDGYGLFIGSPPPKVQGDMVAKTPCAPAFQKRPSYAIGQEGKNHDIGTVWNVASPLDPKTRAETIAHLHKLHSEKTKTAKKLTELGLQMNNKVKPSKARKQQQNYDKVAWKNARINAAHDAALQCLQIERDDRDYGTPGAQAVDFSEDELHDKEYQRTCLKIYQDSLDSLARLEERKKLEQERLAQEKIERERILAELQDAEEKRTNELCQQWADRATNLQYTSSDPEQQVSSNVESTGKTKAYETIAVLDIPVNISDIPVDLHKYLVIR